MSDRTRGGRDVRGLDLWRLVDASAGDFYGLGGMWQTRVGVVEEVAPVAGHPVVPERGEGFMDPYSLRFHVIPRRTPLGTDDRRMGVQILNDYGAEYAPCDAPDDEAPWGQAEWHTTRNRSTREADSRGRTALPSSFRRLIDSEDGLYAIGQTLRSVGLGSSRNPREVNSEGSPDGEPVVVEESDSGRFDVGAVSTYDPETGQWVTGTIGSQEREPDDEPQFERLPRNPLGNVPRAAGGPPAGYVVEETSLGPVVGLTGTFWVPSGRLGDYWNGRDGTPIGLLPARHDAQFAMGADGVGGEALSGRLHLVRDEAASIQPGRGELFKGALWHDASVANVGSALGHESGQWRPVIRVDAQIPPRNPPPWFPPPPWNPPPPRHPEPRRPEDDGDEPEGGGGVQPPPGAQPPPRTPPPFLPIPDGTGFLPGPEILPFPEEEEEGGAPGGVARPLTGEQPPRKRLDILGGTVGSPASQVRDTEGDGVPCPNSTGGLLISSGGDETTRPPGTQTLTGTGETVTTGHPAVTLGPDGKLVLGGWGGTGDPIYPFADDEVQMIAEDLAEGPVSSGVVEALSPAQLQQLMETPGYSGANLPAHLQPNWRDRHARRERERKAAEEERRARQVSLEDRLDARGDRRERELREEQAEERERLAEAAAIAQAALEQAEAAGKPATASQAESDLRQIQRRRERLDRELERLREREQRGRDERARRREARERRERERRERLEELRRRRRERNAERQGGGGRGPATGGYVIDVTPGRGGLVSSSGLTPEQAEESDERRRREQEALGDFWGGSEERARFGDWNVLTSPVPALGEEGGPAYVEGQLHYLTAVVESQRQVIQGAFGGPSFLASNVALIHTNTPGNPPAGSVIGSRWTDWEGTGLEISRGATGGLEVRSELRAGNGFVRAESGGVLEVNRIGVGDVIDCRPAILIEDRMGGGAQACGDMIYGGGGSFVVGSGGETSTTGLLVGLNEDSENPIAAFGGEGYLDSSGQPTRDADVWIDREGNFHAAGGDFELEEDGSINSAGVAVTDEVVGLLEDLGDVGSLSPSNYDPGDGDVAGHLDGIDDAIASAGGTPSDASELGGVGGFIEGLEFSYDSGDDLDVGRGSARMSDGTLVSLDPTTLDMDSTAVSGSTGDLNGLDAFVSAATGSQTSNTITLSQSILSELGVRNSKYGLTFSATGTTCTLSEDARDDVAVGDLVGNSTTYGFARVTAKDGTAITLDQSLPGGEAIDVDLQVIEQPTILIQPDDFTRLDTINAAGTEVKIGVTSTISAGAAVWLGGPDAFATSGSPHWLSLWLIDDGATPGLILSTQRTSLLAAPSGYERARRIGSFDYGQNSKTSVTNLGGGLRYVQYGESFGDLQVISSGAATAWTDVSLAALVPPTSTLAIVTLSELSGSVVVYLRPNGTPGSTVSAPIAAQASTANTAQIATDSAQVIEYANSAGSGNTVAAVVGYYEVV